MMPEHLFYIGMMDGGHFFCYHLYHEASKIRDLINDDYIFGDMVANSMASLDDLDAILNIVEPIKQVSGLKDWLYEADLIGRGTADLVMLKQYPNPHT